MLRITPNLFGNSVHSKEEFKISEKKKTYKNYCC